MGMHPCIWYTALIDYAEALLFISIFALCLLDLSSFLWQLLEFVARARHPFCQLRRHTVSSSFASLTSSSHTHFPASLRFHSTLSLSLPWPVYRSSFPCVTLPGIPCEGNRGGEDDISLSFARILWRIPQAWMGWWRLCSTSRQHNQPSSTSSPAAPWQLVCNV